MPPFQLIDSELCDRLLEEARRSPRLRKNYNFHSGPQDNPHRFLNAMLRGTYVQPHRHLEPPKPESFLVLAGRLAVFLFDDSGRVESRQVLGEGGAIGIDIAPGVWHSLAVTGAYAICYEVKPGPYSAANDKQFAPWAPAEGAGAAARYLESLLAALT